MALLLRLYLAHLIADFILQFDELYALKVKSHWGHFLHVICHFICSILLAWPYLGYISVWIFILVVMVLHFTQDWIKYSLQQDRRKMFPCFVIDQIFHYVFIAGVLLLPVSQMHLGFDRFPALDAYYSNDRYILAAILFTLTTFGGAYLFFNFRKTYIPDSRPNHFISSPEMIHGIIERSLISGVFLLAPSGLWLLLSPLAGLLRFSAPKLLLNRLDFILSFVYAAGLGILFRLWL